MKLLQIITIINRSFQIVATFKHDSKQRVLGNNFEFTPSKNCPCPHNIYFKREDDEEGNFVSGVERGAILLEHSSILNVNLIFII